MLGEETHVIGPSGFVHWKQTSMTGVPVQVAVGPGESAPSSPIGTTSE